VSGLPNNTTATFNPPSVSGSGTSIMTVVTRHNTRRGTYALSISGASGSLVRTTSVQLVVTN
jgi:hypothetical protein